MKHGTITGTVTHTVILGTAGYSSDLLITGTGDISPRALGARGIVVPRDVAGATITNEGTVEGGYGALGGAPGSAAVVLLAAGTVDNSGTIAGGGVTFGYYSVGYQGGTGVDLSAGGTISNTGAIRGGTGSYFGPGGIGGTGVFLDGGVLANQGAITGGPGGGGGPRGLSGPGGVGADLTGGSVGTNSGTITGGAGEYAGAVGGMGVALFDSALINTGDIVGGEGGPDGYSVPGGTGGIGVTLGQGSVLNDAGRISGGAGYYGHVPGYNGGAGIVSDAAFLTVSGSVVGGAGGYGGENTAGNGGDGVVLSGGRLDLTGTITGGTAGYSSSGAGTGGVGVQIDGGTLLDRGTVMGGDVGQPVGYDGDAVAFGSAAATLVLGPQAVLAGRVTATPGAGDVLILADGSGTLTGLGSSVTGFDDINLNKGADWTLAGPATLTAGEHLQDHGSLTLGGSLSGAGTVALEGGAVLTEAAGVSGVSVAFHGAATAVLDHVASFSSTISGFGHGDTIDLANLQVMSASYLNGTLTLKDGSATVGSLAFAGDFTQSSFSVGTDGHGGSEITYHATSSAAPAGDFGVVRHDAGAPAGHYAACLHMVQPEWSVAVNFVHGLAR